MRKVRTDNGLNQEQFAELIGLDNYKVISPMEKGRRSISEKTAHKVIKKFPNIRLQWLLGYDDYETEDDLINANSWHRFDRIELTEQLIRAHGYEIGEYTDPQILTDEETGKEYHRVFTTITAPSGAIKHIETADYLKLLGSINNVLEGLLLLEFKPFPKSAGESVGYRKTP